MSDRLIRIIQHFANDYALPDCESVITLETTIIDLGYDSLDMIELVMFIEDELNIEIADEEIEGVVKIKDLLKVPSIARALDNGV